MDFFPLFLRINANKRILIVGGGAVALAKAEALQPYRAALTVVSEAFSPEMAEFLEAHGIMHSQASYHADHLDGVGLVIAATDDEVANAQIHADAKARGVIVNAVDQPELCDVIFPAIVRRGPLQIAISSSGVSPVLARLVKQRIEKVLPWRFAELIDFAKARRGQVKKALSTFQARRLFWHDVLEGPIAQEVLEGNAAGAEALFDRKLANDNESRAALYLIGAGPGDPELMTVKAIRLLSRADVVLYDRRTAPELLTQYARKEAQKICVGKTKDFHLKNQTSIDGMIEAFLKEGKVVVRLKGGELSIYAHWAEEISGA